MKCPRCLTENIGPSNQCAECGAPLRARKSSQRIKSLRFWLIPLSLCVIIVVVLLWRTFSPDSENIDQVPEQKHLQSEALDVSDAEREAGLVVGAVSIKDPMGEEVSKIDVTVIKDNWVALPAAACLGGDTWIFTSMELDEKRIERGIWILGDVLGLWQLEPTENLLGPELVAWNGQSPLDWYPLMPGNPPQRIQIFSPVKQGNYWSFTLPGNIKIPGIFLQDNQIVGWTFGKWLDQGFLWNGPDTDTLRANASVDEFFDTFSANCQEAQFSKALALGPSAVNEDRLYALADGVLLDSQFADEGKPHHLRLESIVQNMRSLAEGITHSGNPDAVVDILNDQVILKAASPELLMVTTHAWIDAYEYRRASQYFERMKKSLIETGRSDTAGLDDFQLQLYKDWILGVVEQTGPSAGWEAFEAAKTAFPDDTELHLLGVELAFSERNWGRADELLRMRSYPPAFRDRVRNLEVLISEKLSEQGRVMIRFSPTAGEIIVHAALNRTLTQKFILDTGATQVTIPSHTADALGIVIDDSTPAKPVATAGGVGMAYEVTLSSIELKGLRVNNIKALIIDIPGFAEYGLLGNNFLSYFHLEIDPKRGLLYLRRR